MPLRRPRCHSREVGILPARCFGQELIHRGHPEEVSCFAAFQPVQHSFGALGRLEVAAETQLDGNVEMLGRLGEIVLGDQHARATVVNDELQLACRQRQLRGTRIAVSLAQANSASKTSVAPTVP